MGASRAQKKAGRGRSKPRASTSRQTRNERSDSPQINVPTSNNFASLSDNDDMDSTPTPSTSTKTKEKVVSPKPLPIIIKSASMQDIKRMLTHLNITHYDFKHLSIGVKVFVKLSEDFQKLKSFMVEQHIPHFTYQNGDTVPVKYVVYGLNSYTIDDVRNELAQHNILPKNITTLKLKKQRFNDECIYLLYFGKGDTNLNNLRKVKSLFHTIVHWDHYVNKHRGPSQCRNCLMFGHSSNNCGIKSQCVRCGEQHDSDKCRYLVEGAKKIPDDKVKCANCTGKHTANFNKCPKRLEYIAIKAKINERQTKKMPIRNGDFSHTSNRTINNHIVSYSSVVKNPIITKQSSDDLFTATECSQIMIEMINRIKSCKTKSDQLVVITEITMKYLNNEK
jgi:hypothetical protein